MLGRMLQAKLANDVSVMADLHGEILAMVGVSPAHRT